MDKAILRTLDEPTRALIAATKPAELRKLDENALVDLHTRVRRQRNKYTKLYRRRSSAQVGKTGSRGLARPKHPRAAAKAELYEDAMSRVSEALAKVARESAARLRVERRHHAAASAQPRPRTDGPRFVARKGSVRPKARTPISRKRHASTRAMGARRQARRDRR